MNQAPYRGHAAPRFRGLWRLRHNTAISQFISLLAGNLGRRPVRYGLRRQPASAVSRGYFRPTVKLREFGGLRRDGQSLQREFRPSSPARASFDRKTRVANFQYPIFACRDSVRHRWDQLENGNCLVNNGALVQLCLVCADGLHYPAEMNVPFDLPTVCGKVPA